MARALAALLLLLAPSLGAAAARTAVLRVSAQVRRSVTVSVGGTQVRPTAVVSTAAGVVRSGPVGGARAAPAVRAEPSAEHPGYLVVTVLADAAE